ncbi:MAG: hypothetical protein EOO56_02735 [Hymenobacter sp.]|nr:MAG: hypothetical protein EOO56_02735 [Hymenobacter sp.]
MGGRTNPTAGMAGLGQRHSGGGIRLVVGATGEHLGEWEKGEACLIFPRATHANNKRLVDELIATACTGVGPRCANGKATTPMEAP